MDHWYIPRFIRQTNHKQTHLIIYFQFRRMDQSQQNYLRIVAVLNGPGLNAVRCYFDRCFPPNLLNTQLSSVLRKRLEALRQKKVLSKAQWDMLFPANGMSIYISFLFLCNRFTRFDHS